MAPDCEHGSDPMCCIPCQGYRSYSTFRPTRDRVCSRCGKSIPKGSLARRSTESGAIEHSVQPCS